MSRVFFSGSRLTSVSRTKRRLGGATTVSESGVAAKALSTSGAPSMAIDLSASSSPSRTSGLSGAVPSTGEIVRSARTLDVLGAISTSSSTRSIR
jgi:hypothetical protein